MNVIDIDGDGDDDAHDGDDTEHGNLDVFDGQIGEHGSQILDMVKAKPKF